MLYRLQKCSNQSRQNHRFYGLQMQISTVQWKSMANSI